MVKEMSSLHAVFGESASKGCEKLTRLIEDEVAKVGLGKIREEKREKVKKASQAYREYLRNREQEG